MGGVSYLHHPRNPVRFQRLPYKINSAEAESEQIRRCVGSIIFVPDRRRFGDLYVRVRTIELFAFF